MAIGASAYKLVVDATKFAEGTTLSRRELSFLKQTLRETATDADKYAAGISKLDDLHRRGALSTDQHTRAVEQLNAELRSQPAGGADDPFTSWAKGLTATGVAFGAFRFQMNLARDAASAVRDEVADQLEQMNSLINAADSLGIEARAFQNISSAAAAADVPLSNVNSAMEQMLKALSQGKVKGFDGFFEQLGLDAGKLRNARPDVAFATILEAVRGIGNESDRVRAALAIFKDTDVLRLSGQAISDADKALAEFGGHMNALDVERFRQLDDAAGNLSRNLDSVSKNIVKDLIPGLTSAVTLADELLRGSKQFSQTPTGIGAGAFGEGLLSLLPGGREGGTAGTFFRALTADMEAATERSRQLDARLKNLNVQRRELSADEGPTSSGLPGGSADRMYEEDAKMQDIVEKYRQRRIEMEKTGPFLEIHKAKLDGLRGAELELFIAAVDRREAERRIGDESQRQLDIKKSMRDIDISPIRVGSTEEARLMAGVRGRAGVQPALPASAIGSNRELAVLQAIERKPVIEIMEITLN